MSIDPEFERLYSPSAWSNGCRGLERLSKFVKLSNEIVNEYQRTIPCEIDIPYGSSYRTKYDVYGTHLPSDAPVVVSIHGGSWHECTREIAGFGVSNYVERGIKVYIIGYDLCPEVKLTDIVAQVKTVIGEILKICRKNGGTKVWLSGHSAGAHLAASLLYDNEWRTLMTQQNLFQLIKGLVLIAGMFSLRDMLRTSNNKVLKLTDDEIQKFSLNDIDTSDFESVNDIRVIVTVGECDAPMFVEQSRSYAKKLLNFIDRVEYLLLRNKTDHFEIVEKLMDPEFILTKLIIDSIIE